VGAGQDGRGELWVALHQMHLLLISWVGVWGAGGGGAANTHAHWKHG